MAEVTAVEVTADVAAAQPGGRARRRVYGEHWVRAALAAHDP